MKSCFAQVDGVAVHYWRAGSGPALVMVHGLIADGRNWVLNVPAVTPLRTVYAIDMLNMGRSGRVEGADGGLAASAAWLARLLDALEIESADLVGSSHGGAVCLMLTVQHPQRVRSLILFDSANPFCQNPRLPLLLWNSAPAMSSRASCRTCLAGSQTWPTAAPTETLARRSPNCSKAIWKG